MERDLIYLGMDGRGPARLLHVGRDVFRLVGDYELVVRVAHGIGERDRTEQGRD